MKRILTIAILLGMTFGAFAQSSNEYAPIKLPSHGLIEDQEAYLAALTVTQSTQFNGGEWNRFSLYVEVDDPLAILQELETQLSETGIIIESANYSTENYGEMWYGELDDEGVNNDEMYLIQVSDDVTINLTGTPADPATHQITIKAGQWNRIGFPCSEVVSVEDALADFEAVEGDFIEGPNGSTEYYEGVGWFGDGMDEFVPGEGYMFNSASSEDRPLVFSTGAKSRSAKHTLVKPLVKDNNSVVKTSNPIIRTNKSAKPAKTEVKSFERDQNRRK